MRLIKVPHRTRRSREKKLGYSTWGSVSLGGQREEKPQCPEEGLWEMQETVSRREWEAIGARGSQGDLSPPR